MSVLHFCKTDMTIVWLKMGLFQQLTNLFVEIFATQILCNDLAVGIDQHMAGIDYT